MAADGGSGGGGKNRAHRTGESCLLTFTMNNGGSGDGGEDVCDDGEDGTRR